MGARKKSVYLWVQQKRRCAGGCKESINVLVGTSKASACDKNGRRTRNELEQLLTVIWIASGYVGG